MPLEESPQSLLHSTIMQATDHFNEIMGNRLFRSRCRYFG